MSLDTSAKPPAPAPIDGLPPELRRWAVAAIFTALAMASLDTAIANIALPAIAADLHVSPADVVWVVNIYQIALVATLLPLGALGEIVGHRRVYLGGLLLFTLASLGCAFAWSLPSLTAARALQGLGASGIMSVNAALVRFVYPTRMLGRGFGHNALVVGTAFTFGPTIASAILSLGTWPWLFAINIPFGVIAMWAIFAVALLALLRRRLGLRTWRIVHMSLAVVIVAGSVTHAMLVEGPMETISKAALCALVLAAAIKVMADLVRRMRATSRGESPARQ